MTKKVTEKKKLPAHCKFSDEVKRQCEILYREGFTDAKVSNVLGVTEQTINNWKHAHCGFFESIKDWKYEADHQIEKSLFQRAKGFTLKETKVGFHEGASIVEIVDKNYPPDTASMIFWLKNRKPNQWRDKQEVTVDLSKMPDEMLLNLIRPALGEIDANKDENSD